MKNVKEADGKCKELLNRMAEESKKERTPSIVERLLSTHKGGNE